MARRYVIVSEKIDGEEAVLNAATMRQLGLKDKDTIAVTSITAFYMLPVIAGNAAPDQIKLPYKASGAKEGERLSIEPTADSMVPEPAKPERPALKSAESFTWDPIPDTGFDEIVGLNAVKARIEQALYYLTHPEWFLIRKSQPPRVFMLFGPYGCGKTMLAKGMASRLANAGTKGKSLDVRLKIVKTTEIKDPYLGMSARSIQHHLDAAREACNKGATVLLVLDEIDSLVGTRTGGQIHEEYRDIVNTVLTEVHGTRELDAESRIHQLQKEADVQALREELAKLVRARGQWDHGDIMLREKDWTDDIKEKMLRLRAKIMEAGGVSTVIIVGTTNDPCRIDEGFVSRAGDNVFFIPRPPSEAIEEMLAHQLDSAFVELKDEERRELAQEAFLHHLTGRDIMLGWLQPLRTMAPGALTIMGYHTILSHMPQPTVGIEWELDLLRRLREKGHILMAAQVQEYLDDVKSAESMNGHKPKQPALFK